MSNSKSMEDKHVTEMLTWLYESKNPHRERVLRNETGHCNLRNADYIQTYNWPFFFYSTDGEGEFTWFIHPRKHIYGNSMSVKGKEGYGRMSYLCGSYFEGLLLNNERFGPGVYTNSAGKQDVGIWLGNKLVRLIRSLPEIKMLQIAREKDDKIKILRYRTMISINENRWQNIVKNLIKNNISDLDRPLRKGLNELCRPTPNDRRSLWYHVLDNEYMQKYLHEEKESITALSTMDMKVTKAIPNNNPRQSYLSASKVTNKEDTLKEKKNSNDVRVKIAESDTTFFINQHLGESINVDYESPGDQFYCGIKGFSENDQMSSFEGKWHIFANINDNDFPSIENPINYSEKRKSRNSNFDEFDRIETILEFPTEATVMTHLLAWNNNQAMIDILKHVFRHRNDEILAGKRGEFRQEGAHEMAALNFLIASSNGFKNTIRQIILKENLDVNLADNGGNTGLIYAAVSDRLEAIDTLLDLGADINCINDECSTPLSLCILRLLESVHGVVDRSKAFLPKNIESINLKQSDFLINDNNVLANLQQWCPKSMFPYEQVSSIMKHHLPNSNLKCEPYIPICRKST
ncbi:uncharacterized protein LOC112493746 [Cephus cinctus]|uniref:Uncharacterized protein LOC112493746 n=1 Tax=Cephus cinctus TaxID=211228 RepID=A0AAJ7R8T1_CEPCN|nr:uncharacterized protein LOC112493746 [Cephus cinctus]